MAEAAGKGDWFRGVVTLYRGANSRDVRKQYELVRREGDLRDFSGESSVTTLGVSLL